MKIIVLGIIAFISLLLIRVREGLGFTDGNINTAPFDATGTIPGYKDAGTRQWGEKMANNAAAAYRMGGRSMLVNNVVIAIDEEKTFDTGRIYTNSYIQIRGFASFASHALPYIVHADSPSIYLISSYGSWGFECICQITSTATKFETHESGLTIKSVNAGGFIIKNDGGAAPIYVTALITEIRNLTAE